MVSKKNTKINKQSQQTVEAVEEDTDESLDTKSTESEILEYMLHYRSLKADSGINIYIQLEPNELVPENGVLSIDTSTQSPSRAEYVSGTVNRFFIAKNVLNAEDAKTITSIKLNPKISLNVSCVVDSTDENWNVYSYTGKEAVMVNGKAVPQDEFYEVLHNQFEKENSKTSDVDSEVVNQE